MIEVIIDTIRGCWRFRRRGLILAWLCVLAGWLFLGVKSNIYHAEATVFIGPDVEAQVLANLSADRQPAISDLERSEFAVTNRDRLQEIARDVRVTQEGSGQLEPNVLLDQFQQRIWIADNERWPNVYTAYFRSTDPGLSLQVVEALLQILAEEVESADYNANGEEKLSLAERIEASESRVAVAEQQLAHFRQLNPGIVLNDERDGDSPLYQAIEQLAAVEGRLVDAERRRDQLEDRLQGEHATDSGSASTQSIAEDTLDSRILALTSKLDDLLQNLTIDHPDVVVARNTLETLKVRREQQLVSLGFTRAEARSLPLGSSSTYRDLFKLVSETRREVTGLRNEVAARKAKVAEIQAVFNVGSEVKAEFESLNRRLAAAQSEHRKLLASAGTLASSESDERESNFKIINLAAVGSHPVKPDRARWMTWILIASLCAGAGLALVLNLRQPVFYHGRQIQEATGLPVVAAVTHAWKEGVQSRFRRDLVAFSIGIFAMVAGSAFVLALQNQSVVMQ